MKTLKNYPFIIALFITLLFCVQNLFAQNTSVPDDNFEQALIDLGYDTVLDDLVLTANINTIQNLNISNKNIADLTGIEDFTALRFLQCNNNQLTSINLAQNTALIFISIKNNQLSSLDLSSNTLLENLNCNNNLLTNLNVTSPVLRTLSCSNNQLTNLDVSSCIALEELFFINNLITSINVSQNIALEKLIFVDNAITSLDVSQNLNLENLNCGSNQLTSLGVSQNTMLTRLTAYDNLLTSLDVSQNTLLEVFACNNNSITTIDVSQNTALTSLTTRYNPINNLDVTSNSDLTSLSCEGNQLTNLDVSQNTALQYLSCGQNSLTSLDLSLHTALIYLRCDDSQLTSLNVRNGNNSNFIAFVAYTNPNLLCINVDDVAYANTNFTDIDAVASFNTNCSGITYDLSTTIVGNGTVNPNSGTFVENDNISITATPDAGWVFDNWSGDASGTDNPLAVTMNADKNITANFSEIQTYVPDDNFEQALIDLGYDTVLDDYIPTSNISSITQLQISNKSIADLTGIEDFSSLTSLNCDNNLLTSLPISQNTLLESLECEGNLLTTFNISQNSNLIGLKCSNNQLRSLNITANPLLHTLFCDNNLLSSLDLTQNLNLFRLRCYNNNLTTLDVSQNTSIAFVECMNNQISSIDLSQNLDLEWLRCQDNQITDLDLSQNTVLNYLDCHTNQLTILNVKNGNNNNVTTFNATSNPNLLCIDVDDVTYATANFTNVDATASFSLDCSGITYDLTVNVVGNGTVNPNSGTFVENDNISIIATPDAGWVFDNWSGDASGTDNPLAITMNSDKNITANFSEIQTYVPDDNFEQALIDLGYDTVLDNYVPTPNIDTVTNLDVSNKNIADLTGIEDFSSLTSLNCNNNALTGLSILQNTLLESLECEGNLLTTFNISQNSNLKGLKCSNNQLRSLNITANPLLQTLFCNNNSLSSLDLTQNPNLFTLWCYNNNLTALDLSQNVALNYLDCQSNQLTSLNVKNGNNNNVTTFNAISNPNLLCIDVDDVAYATANFTNVDATASFSTDCATASVLDENLLIFSIYPNPVNDVIYIETTHKIKKVWIYNMLGQEIKTATNKTIPILNLDKGIYVIKVLTTKNQITTNRFIKR